MAGVTHRQLASPRRDPKREGESVPELACLNGVFAPPGALSVPIEDRGYVFGDGVYETMRTYGGRVWALDRHMRRLERSLREVAITTAPLDDIRRWIAAGMNQCALQGAVVYVQVTRGVAPRQHTFSADIIPTVMLTSRQFTPVSEDQRRLGVSAITVPDIRWGRRDIKSTNLLPNVLAKQQAHEAGAFE